MAKDNLRTWKFLGIAAVAVVIVLVIANIGERQVGDISAAGNPSIGDGELVVYLFEDYECPHCAEYSTGAENTAFADLIETWVDTDKITLVFKHVAIVGQGTSWDAARASRCVYDQATPEQWLEWDHDLYEEQIISPAFAASESNVQPITRDWADEHAPDFDMGEYRDCLKADDELNAITEQNINEFQQNGIGGTPGMLIGNQVVNPNQSSQVDALIQQALNDMADETEDADGNGTE